MSDVIFFLRMQADSLDDTAKRCTDPVIVSELQYTISELRTQADKLEGQFANSAVAAPYGGGPPLSH